MTILLDTSTIQHEMSGTGYYTLGMLRELQKMDSVDHVHVLGGNSELLEKQNKGKLILHFRDEQNWHRLLNLKMIGNRPNLKGDVAIFPNYFMPPGFSIPSMVTVHDLSFISHPHLYKWKMRKYYKSRTRHTFHNAERILTVSEESKRAIIEYSGRAQEDVITISPGPTLPLNDLIHQQSFPSNYFLLNGNIENRKNINPTIKAFLDADLKDFKLVIIGKQFCKGSYWKEFKRLTDQSEQIHYLGYIDNEQLKLWYSHSSGIVCCSFIEGFGIPALNGFAMNKPSMISDIAALKEAAGEPNLLVDPYDPLSLSNGFKELAALGFNVQRRPADSYILKYDHFWKKFSQTLEEAINKLTFTSSSYSFKFFSVVSPLKRSILETLAYASVFNAPIKLRECYLELPVKCSYDEFRRELRELSASYSGIFVRGAYAGLKNYVRSLQEYQNAHRENEVFIDKHQKLINKIGKLPWISGIYYSGGTVHANHGNEKDIDLFIISECDRLWLLYSLLKTFAFISRSNKVLCFNYLIDKDTLSISAQQDLYTAHQILHLKQAVKKKNHPDLKSANPWIYKYFPNSMPDKSYHADDGSESGSTKKNSTFMEMMNLSCMWVWTKLWNHKNVRNRTGGIRWDAHQIKLHTNDHRPKVYQNFTDIKSELNNDLFKKHNRPIDCQCA